VLFPTPILKADDLRVLAEIDAARERLQQQVASSSIKLTTPLRSFLTADAVAASNSIEGFKVSTIDVEDILEGERDVEVSEDNLHETLAYLRTMTAHRA
jgi:hypothetical protein